MLSKNGLPFLGELLGVFPQLNIQINGEFLWQLLKNQIYQIQYYAPN